MKDPSRNGAKFLEVSFPNMAENDTGLKNLRDISEYFFDKSKRWWNATWYLKLAAFAFGLFTTLFPSFSLAGIFLVATVSFASEVCNILSNKYKGSAESLRRKLDFCDSFGWEISNIETADVVVKLPQKIQMKILACTDPDDYFASRENSGTRRAMQNLQESSWWSKHLSEMMATYSLIGTITLVTFSIAALIASSLMISDSSQLTGISRLVIALLLLIVSLGLIPLTINYRTFHRKAVESEKMATSLLQSNPVNEIQAIKAFNEYHLARASAPLIPTFLWKIKNKSLNKAWDRFVVEHK